MKRTWPISNSRPWETLRDIRFRFYLRTWNLPSHFSPTTFYFYIRDSESITHTEGLHYISQHAALANLSSRFRGGEFLEARIVAERIEHWIEPEQRGRERHVLRSQRASIGCRVHFL